MTLTECAVREKLSPTDRKFMAIQAMARTESITALAARHGVSGVGQKRLFLRYTDERNHPVRKMPVSLGFRVNSAWPVSPTLQPLCG